MQIRAGKRLAQCLPHRKQKCQRLLQARSQAAGPAGPAGPQAAGIPASLAPRAFSAGASPRTTTPRMQEAEKLANQDAQSCFSQSAPPHLPQSSSDLWAAWVFTGLVCGPAKGTGF